MLTAPPVPPQYPYEYPSYDAPRYPDMRPRVPLTPVSPGMLDFRMQRFIHDYPPQGPLPAPQPPQNLGMTLNSLPFAVRAQMGAYNG